MIRKPTPMKLSSAVQESIRNQLNTQVVQKGTPKSTDPKNFPVFDITPGKKYLVYVPNHVVEGENGPELRMDKPLLHQIKDGKRFGYYRCLSGIEAKDENGNVIFDGTCPLCDGTSVTWDLANLRIREECRLRNLNPDEKENKTVKDIRSREYNGRILKDSNRYYTFPIVVIETVNDDGKTIAKDENGNPSMTPMWYHISEGQYNKKWIPCLEGMEDEPTHPGGHFFTLNYPKIAKSDNEKRDASQNLTVIARSVKNEKLKSVLDDKTQDWTPEKAQETVVTNQLYSLEDLTAIADDITAGPRATIALMEAKGNGALEGGNAEGFNLKPPAEGTAALTDSSTQMDETDADEDLDFDS